MSFLQIYYCFVLLAVLTDYFMFVQQVYEKGTDFGRMNKWKIIQVF